MILEGILVGVIVAGFGFSVRNCIDLGQRLTRVEIIQRLQLRHNGVGDEDIDLELNNHKKGGHK